MIKTFSTYHYLVVIFVLVLLVFATPLVQAQAWERSYNYADIQDIVQTADGRFVVAGNTLTDIYGETSVYLMKVDELGEARWSTTFNESGLGNNTKAMIATSDNGFALAGSNDGNVYIIKADANGNELWTSHYSIGEKPVVWSIVQNQDQTFTLAGYFENELGSIHIFLAKVTNEALIWRKDFSGGNDTFNDAFRVVITDDDGYFIIGNSFNQALCIKTNAAGIEEWRYTNELETTYEGNTTPDGNVVIAGHASVDDFAQPFVKKLAIEDGTVVWEQTYPSLNNAYDIYEIFSTADGGLAMVTTNPFDAFGQVILAQMEADGTLIQYNNYGKNTILSQAYGGIEIRNGGGFMLGGWIVPEQFSNSFLVKTNGNGGVLTQYLQGNAYHDINNNCAYDLTTDASLTNWVVEIINNDETGETLFTNTNAEGYFIAALDTGSYTVNLIPDNHLFDFTCISSSQNVNISEAYDTTSIHFPAQSAANTCPFMLVDVSTPLLRKCFTANYVVKYCNTGTALAENAFIELTFDPYLVVNNSSLLWSFQDGDVYTFELGDVLSNQCGEFVVNVSLNCDDPVINQTHCVSALIYPQEFCEPLNPSWDGSSISVKAICQNDKVEFSVTNDGISPSISASILEIYEDDLLRVAGDINLDTNQDSLFTIDAGGKTIRMVVEQSEGHPGKSYPRAVFEGCGENEAGDISTGFVSTVFEDDLDHFKSISCQQNVSLGNLQLLNASPSGVYEAHYINATDELEYHIHFQNTLADTAHYIVVRDTIAPELAITSLQLGAVSHPHTFNIRPGNVLEWVFDSIAIPPNTINELQSHGFIKYKIGQQADNDTTSYIQNTAWIYVNYEAPTSTNTTWHTVGQNYFLINFVDDKNTKNQDVRFTINPNPFTNYTTIELKGKPYQNLSFEIYDLTGRSVKTITLGRQTTFELNSKILNTGIYIYRLNDGTSQLATGKIIVQ